MKDRYPPLIALVLFAVAFSTDLLGARELHWRSLDVQARLDPEGALHVVERHEMVFTGDWNGGERVFRLEPGQRIDVSGVARIAGGRPILLERGELDAVDQWARVDQRTVRWRSRLQDDPPFDGDVLTYEIAYVTTGVVEQRGEGRYRLRHDFAFPDREGPIEQFRVRLALDEPWVSPRGRMIEETSESLAPGENHVITLTLTYVADAQPSATLQVAGPLFRAVAVGALLAALLFTFVNWLRRESATGRLAPLPEVTAAGITRELEFWRPELLGAAWDESVSAPEVAAVLARLAQEGKITTTVDGDRMEMKLNVPRDQFSGIDRALVDAFFITGSVTSTDEIQHHYASSGFSPASLIQKPLEDELSSIRGWSKDTRRRPWTLTLASLGAALITWAAAIGASPLLPLPLLPVIAIGAALTLLAGSAVSLMMSRKPHLTHGAILAWNILPLLYVLAGVVALFATSRLTAPFVFATVVALWAAYRFQATLAHTTMTAPRIELRRRLLSIREWFREQLEQAEPQLRDDWLPWLVALGLGANVDRWFGTYGSGLAAPSRAGFSSSGGGSGGAGSSPVGGSWSGGGTSFGGAGATATWVAAATGIAGGVSAPGSSGGGGGGGSSSGGGGGGGW